MLPTEAGNKEHTYVNWFVRRQYGGGTTRMFSRGEEKRSDYFGKTDAQSASEMGAVILVLDECAAFFGRKEGGQILCAKNEHDQAGWPGSDQPDVWWTGLGQKGGVWDGVGVSHQSVLPKRRDF